jgi:hypothetical protein
LITTTTPIVTKALSAIATLEYTTWTGAGILWVVSSGI